MLIDSHAHLALFTEENECEAVIQNALEQKVTTLLTIGTNLHDSRMNIEIARQHPAVFATVGVHPHDVKDVALDAALTEIRTLAEEKKVVGVGEIGLDYYRNLSPPDVQREFFRRQLELALELGLPVIIHDREAHDDVLQILEEVDVSSIGGVLHCFSGNLAMAERVRELGLLISIAGPVTFKNAGFLPEIAAKMPLETLLVETDCPFLAPVPFRGKRNEPAYVWHVAEKIAELRGIPKEAVAEQTSRNFATVFRCLQ